MAYNKINWTEDTDGEGNPLTPVSAENLNHMDEGVAQIDLKNDSGSDSGSDSADQQYTLYSSGVGLLLVSDITLEVSGTDDIYARIGWFSDGVRVGSRAIPTDEDEGSFTETVSLILPRYIGEDLFDDDRNLAILRDGLELRLDMEDGTSDYNGTIDSWSLTWDLSWLEVE